MDDKSLADNNFENTIPDAELNQVNGGMRKFELDKEVMLENSTLMKSLKEFFRRKK